MNKNWTKYLRGEGYLHSSGAKVEKVTSVVISSLKEVPESTSNISNIEDYRYDKKLNIFQRFFQYIFPPCKTSSSVSYQKTSTKYVRETREEINDLEWSGKWILRYNNGWKGPFDTPEQAAASLKEVA